MRLMLLPGVFRPLSDSRLLARCVRDQTRAGDRALDLCTGSGVVAVSAALSGARVTAVDVSRRAVANARLNGLLNGVGIRSLRGDLTEPVEDERFELIASNPPYVPAPTVPASARGSARAWAAGPDGRAVLDRICSEAPRLLAPGGRLLIVHSDVCGTERTLGRLEEAGLAAQVVARERGPLGPLMTRARRPANVKHETVVVIAAGASESEPLAVYRAPMRARNLDLAPGAGADHGVKHGLVATGDALAALPRTLDEAVRAAAREHGEKAGRLLRAFAAAPEGTFVWTRTSDGLFQLGRINGPWRYDASPEARRVGLVHARPAEWLDRPFGPGEVPGAVTATFARGGRNFQRTRDEAAECRSRELWERR